jgi:hypothetical protein
LVSVGEGGAVIGVVIDAITVIIVITEITEAVTIGVSLAWVGDPNAVVSVVVHTIIVVIAVEHIGHTVAIGVGGVAWVAHLGTIIYTVAVGVCAEGVGANALLIGVRERIAVGVEGAIVKIEGIKAVLKLLKVVHEVAVAVTLAVIGTSASLSETRAQEDLRGTGRAGRKRTLKLIKADQPVTIKVNAVVIELLDREVGVGESIATNRKAAVTITINVC